MFFLWNVVIVVSENIELFRTEELILSFTRQLFNQILRAAKSDAKIGNVSFPDFFSIKGTLNTAIGQKS